MGFLLEADPSCLVVTHLLYKAVLAFAVLRWVLSWAFRLRDRVTLSSQNHHPIPPVLSSISPRLIRENLVLTTFGDVKGRQGPRVSDTCAVCLSQLFEVDEVRELRNCCHVFHRGCIDRWVDHDQQHRPDHDLDHGDGNHKSCPLCRAPLLTASQVVEYDGRDEPSWVVERLLYIFGDDLLA